MSHRKILDGVLQFFICGLLTACSADNSPSHNLPMPESGNSDEVLFQQRCHDCHVPPYPQSRPASAWPAIVERMQSHRIRTGLQPLTDEEMQRIKGYLQRNAEDAT